MAFQLANPIGTGSDQELLEFTRAAIAQITLHGQAYTIDGRELTRADLRSLREQLTWLECRINGAAGNSANNYARFRRPV